MNAPSPTPATAPRHRWLRRLGWAVLAVLVLIALALSWLLATGSGLRFALGQASRLSGGALSVQQARGTLAGPLRLDGLRYHSSDGLDVRIGHLTLDIGVWSLLAEHARVQNLEAEQIQVDLPTSSPAATQDSGPFSLRAPLDVYIERAHVGHTQIKQGSQTLFVADSLDLAGDWTHDALQLRTLALKAPQGHVRLKGQLGFGPGYPGALDGDLAWKQDGRSLAATMQARSDGRVATLDLKLSAPTPSTVHVRIDQAHSYAWTAALETPAFDPQALLGPGGIQRLGLSLHGHGDARHGQFQGQVQVNGTRIDLAPLNLALSQDAHTLQLDPLSVHSPQLPGRLTARGTVHLDADPLTAQLTLAWQDVKLPADLAGQALDTHGQVAVQGSAAQFAVRGDLAIGPPGRLAQIALNLDGTPAQVRIHRLTVRQAQGQLDASGQINLGSPLGWHLDLDARHFDPGQLLAGWNGNLDATLSTQGTLEAKAPQATLHLKQLAGTLRQRRLAGHGTLTLTPSGVVHGQLDLRSGQSRLQLQAADAARNQARIRIDVASLADWLPNAQGGIRGHIDVNGLWPQLSLRSQLQGHGITVQGQRIQQLSLNARVPDTRTPGGDIDLRAGDATLGGLHFDTVTVSAHGQAKQHHLALDAKGQPLSVHLALDGQQTGENWTGRLQTLDLDVQGLPRWRLTTPAGMALKQGAFSLSQACLSAGTPQLCLAGSSQSDGSLKASYRLHALPLALLATLAGGDLPVRADGTLNGQGQISRDAKGMLAGHAELDSAQGHVAYVDHPQQPLLSYSQFNASADLDGTGQQLRVQAALNDGGRLDGQVGISGSNQALRGELQLHLKSLAFIELLTAEVANVKGQLDADLHLAGDLGKPIVGGSAEASGLALEVPAAGLSLHDGQIHLATGDQQQLTLDGHIQSGKGQLKLDGQAGLAPGSNVQLHISGSQFTAADIPAAQVTISPDLTLKQSAQGVNVNGSVHIDRADVDLTKLPGAGAAQGSPDVVIVDEKQQKEKAQAMPITASVQVDLGQRTHLKGFGLNGRLRGALRVSETPGRGTIGQGQIQVDGTYRAYGQDLRIEQGRLLFASTPVANPGLDIRAVRKLNPNATIDEGQEVGLQIAGTAQRPVITVFSNPSMEQSDALSYLITGKPLSQVKGGEGNMVGAAAQALGSAAGDLLAKSIGSRIGVDEIGVSNNDALGGASAFTVGKYLSPRLYLSYGVGLFEPGQVITMRYRLSQRWNVEIENATEFNRASLNYRLEK